MNGVRRYLDYPQAAFFTTKQYTKYTRFIEATHQPERYLNTLPNTG